MSTVVQYLVVIENGGTCYGAYVPDLPGCVATGKTEQEATRHIADAIRRRMQEMRQAGKAVAEPRSTHRYVFVTAETADDGMDFGAE